MSLIWTPGDNDGRYSRAGFERDQLVQTGTDFAKQTPDPAEQTPVLTPDQERECDQLFQRIDRERAANPGFRLPVEMDHITALAIAGSLQLALRHPGHSGASAAIARHLVDGIRQRFLEAGMPAHAQLVDLGNQPVCRGCGCMDVDPCVDNDGRACSWVEKDLCDFCYRGGQEPSR